MCCKMHLFDKYTIQKSNFCCLSLAFDLKVTFHMSLLQPAKYSTADGPDVHLGPEKAAQTPVGQKSDLALPFISTSTSKWNATLVCLLVF